MTSHFDLLSRASAAIPSLLFALALHFVNWTLSLSSLSLPHPRSRGWESLENLDCTHTHTSLGKVTQIAPLLGTVGIYFPGWEQEGWGNCLCSCGADRFFGSARLVNKETLTNPAWNVEQLVLFQGNWGSFTSRKLPRIPDIHNLMRKTVAAVLRLPHPLPQAFGKQATALASLGRASLGKKESPENSTFLFSV